MSTINKLKEKSLSYFTLLLNDKSEAFKLLALVLFAIYLTFKFIGGYDSTSGYDVRTEFCGYLMQFSFFAFLYVSFKAKEQQNTNCGLKCLSLIQLLLAITNFLIIKSVSTYFIFKLIVLFATISLFLVLIRLISHNSSPNPLINNN
jgi:hypothetical protein